MTTWQLVVYIVASVGCGGGDDPALTDEQTAFVVDGLESIDTDGTVVDQVEVTLSGNVDPAQSADAAASASVLGAEARLTPSTCIDSTVQGNVVTHVLTGCTGPGGRMLAGTIVSTWTQDGACLHVDHVTSDFTIGARAATGSLGVTICRSGTTEMRTRDLDLSATTRTGKPISLAGSWQISLDTVTGCATQSGTVTGQIGDHMFDRTDTELEWCSTQAKRAPLDEAASVLKLVGGVMGYVPGSGVTVEFRVEFLGDDTIRVTDPEGNVFAFIVTIDAQGAVGLQPTFIS